MVHTDSGTGQSEVHLIGLIALLKKLLCREPSAHRFFWGVDVSFRPVQKQMVLNTLGGSESTMPINNIKIMHVSDLHISEKLLEPPDAHLRVPHRYGHDIKVFLALNEFLSKSSWDILVISGDVSRIGNPESFFFARNWLENELTTGALQIGLNLRKITDKHYVIVPGNHDRFNGTLEQISLDAYENEFGSFRPGQIKTLTVNGVTVNFHLIDSTNFKGSFAYGQVDARALVPRMLNMSELNIAVLHHHFIQPPGHKREKATEMVNSEEVASFALSTGFHAVLFGHTHKSYLDMVPADLVSRLLTKRRARGRMWKRKIPKLILSLLRISPNNNPITIAYKREPAANGQLPTLESYFTFLFLKGVKGITDVKGPSEFDSIKQFYEHLYGYTGAGNLKQALDSLKRSRVLLSMSPSARQAEAERKGLHELEFSFENNALKKVRQSVYEYKGVAFQKVDGLDKEYLIQ